MGAAKSKAVVTFDLRVPLRERMALSHLLGGLRRCEGCGASSPPMHGDHIRRALELAKVMDLQAAHAMRRETDEAVQAAVDAERADTQPGLAPGRPVRLGHDTFRYLLTEVILGRSWILTTGATVFASTLTQAAPLARAAGVDIGDLGASPDALSLTPDDVAAIVAVLTSPAKCTAPVRVGTQVVPHDVPIDNPRDAAGCLAMVRVNDCMMAPDGERILDLAAARWLRGIAAARAEVVGVLRVANLIERLDAAIETADVLLRATATVDKDLAKPNAKKPAWHASDPFDSVVGGPRPVGQDVEPTKAAAS